ncbi:hypothetical protein A9Q88_06060 [Gammaproteobacteria bacterium 50_400_T64]|nr:hypothetical protein A9Q88_06060 [Gammaproteobacteria bacterium 50_400_T64]
MNIFNKQYGVSVIKFIALTPLILIGLVVLAFIFTLLNKAYWDYRVEKMCEKDGGVTVYEIINLPKKSELISFSGNVIIPNQGESNSSDPYYIAFSETIVKNRFPQVRRTETKIIRSIDLRLLSLRVSYSRGGGDFPTGIAAPSSFSCRSLKNINSRLIKSTFSVKEI